MPRFVSRLLLCSLIGLLSFEAVCAQQANPVRDEPSEVRLARVLSAVAAGEEFDGDSPTLIPDLIEVLRDGEHSESDLAILALAKMKSRANPAIPRLCRKLSDSSPATRDAAVSTLVSIGKDSVATLRKLLLASSPRARAASAKALSLLQSIDVDELDRLVQDSDPRVRAAAADALSRMEKAGVVRLASLLRDGELAVTIEAAAALRSNHSDQSMAIAALIQALPRAELGAEAADSLAAYGVAANRAIPAIISAYPLGSSDSARFGWDDAAEKALKHIGPPDQRDVPLLCELLSSQHYPARNLAAQSLGLLGLGAKSAASALESAAAAAVEDVLMKKKTEADPNEMFDKTWQTLSAAEECCAALWHVTRDVPRFRDLVERLVITADEPMAFRDPVLGKEFSSDDFLSIESCLRSSNQNLV